MSDTYRDIGFDFQPHRLRPQGRHRRSRFPKGLYRRPFPAGRPSHGRPRSGEHGDAACRRAQGASADRVLLHRLHQCARRSAVEDPAVVNEFHHGHPSTELDERIYDKSYDMIVCKTAPSIFFNTPVASYFVKEGVDTVIITGCNTSGCVRASINDAFSTAFVSSCRGRAAATWRKARIATICATSGVVTPTWSAWTKCSPISRRPGAAIRTKRREPTGPRRRSGRDRGDRGRR